MDYETVLGTITIGDTKYPVTAGFIVLLFVKHVAEILTVHYYSTGATLSGLTGPVIAVVIINVVTLIEYKRDFDSYHDTNTNNTPT